MGCFEGIRVVYEDTRVVFEGTRVVSEDTHAVDVLKAHRQSEQWTASIPLELHLRYPSAG